ncbi:hypothetical protein PC128_g25292 [Phytophthora cactorum]|nr:hypothetical protein PC128_g25292 [Phytophthora cactorum]
MSSSFAIGDYRLDGYTDVQNVVDTNVEFTGSVLVDCQRLESPRNGTDPVEVV